MADRRHAARIAKDMVRAVRPELIIGQRRRIAQQPKRLGLHLRVPAPLLGADRAIALTRPRRQVDVGFELHRAAVARTMVGLEHRRKSSSSWAPIAGRSEEHTSELQSLMRIP